MLILLGAEWAVHLAQDDFRTISGEILNYKRGKLVEWRCD